jgi:hypothetical protein
MLIVVLLINRLMIDFFLCVPSPSISSGRPFFPFVQSTRPTLIAKLCDFGISGSESVAGYPEIT